MSANVYKRLNVSDTFVVPYTANKSWDITSESFAANRINVLVGINHSGSTFNPTSEYISNNQYDRLVYDSVNLTYYPNFLPRYINISSKLNTLLNDGTLTTSSYFRGHIELGNSNTVKYFPTGANAYIYVLNIPKSLTSEKILPTTFEAYFATGSAALKIYDDGNYNLLYSGSDVSSSIGTVLTYGSQVGNIFYEQNIAILTVVPDSILATSWRGADPYCIQASPSPTPTVSATPSVTPTVTPSVSVTPSVTISVTPSITASPNLSLTPTQTITPTPTVTPTITSTPSISITPTPTVTPTPTTTPVYNYYYYGLTACGGGGSECAIIGRSATYGLSGTYYNAGSCATIQCDGLPDQPSYDWDLDNATPVPNCIDPSCSGGPAPSLSPSPTPTPSTSNPTPDYPTVTGVFNVDNVSGECYSDPGNYETVQTWYVTFASAATINGTVRITFDDSGYADCAFNIGETQSFESTGYNCGCSGTSCRGTSNVVSTTFV